MRDKRAIAAFCIAIAGIFLSFYFDDKIIKFVSLFRSALLDKFFLGITLISSEIIIFFVLTSLFLWNENKRKWIFPLWLTLFFSAAISFLFKISIHRLRPYQTEIVSTLSFLQESSHLTWSFSFPSSHALIAFSTIPLLSKEFPKLKYFWLIFAVLVAFSRVYFGVHYLSDVLSGALIGYAIGFLIVKYEEENKFGEKIYRKIFGRKLVIIE